MGISWKYHGNMMGDMSVSFPKLDVTPSWTF
jgi:hypothetical protein